MANKSPETALGKKSIVTEASCRRSIGFLEELIGENRTELRKAGLEVEELRSEFNGLEIRQKGRHEEILKSGLQDIKFLEKTLSSMAVDDENELLFLKKQSAGLINEKIILQQHIISLTSRVNNAEMDVYQEGVNANL